MGNMIDTYRLNEKEKGQVGLAMQHQQHNATFIELSYNITAFPAISTEHTHSNQRSKHESLNPLSPGAVAGCWSFLQRPLMEEAHSHTRIGLT
ncbi:Uncharacterized protein HZ326_26904 [Fusarium oxysporum f. sp. albedinis]|nr:Uncharacterized protein HZ326_26904 [Fusarium oxysporum f. sp. albedinis]